MTTPLRSMSVAKLTNSFKSRNRTTRQFREFLGRLDRDGAVTIATVRAAAEFFDKNPSHPSLRHHELKDTKRGNHNPHSFSVSVTMDIRAIYVVKSGVNVWYWIGTHKEYDVFTGGK